MGYTIDDLMLGDFGQYPWHRLSNESSRWYERFARFVLAGSSRTLNETYNSFAQEAAQFGGLADQRVRTKTAPKSWVEAATKFQWRRRAEAWDMHRIRMESQERLAALRQLRMRQLEVANSALEQYEDMISYPKTRKKYTQDGQTIIIEPTRWGIGAAVQMARLWSELSEKALEAQMPEEMMLIEGLVRAGILPERALHQTAEGVARLRESLRKALSGLNLDELGEDFEYVDGDNDYESSDDDYTEEIDVDPV